MKRERRNSQQKEGSEKQVEEATNKMKEAENEIRESAAVSAAVIQGSK